MEYLIDYIRKHRQSAVIRGIETTPSYELKNREKSFKELDTVFHTLKAAMDKTSFYNVGRGQFKIPMLAGASGMGKTSVIHHLSHRLHTKTVVQCHIQYTTTTSNSSSTSTSSGYSISSLELQYFDAIASVAHRMLYTTFLHNNTDSLGLDQYMVDMYDAGLNSLSLNMAVSVLRRVYELDHPDKVFRSRHTTTPADESTTPTGSCDSTGTSSVPQQQPFQLLLAIDDCQELNKFQKSSAERGLDQVCHALIAVMREGTDELYPILASTDYEAVTVNMLSDRVAMNYITLPPVAPVEILQSVRAVRPFALTPLVAALAYRLPSPHAVVEFAELLSATEDSSLRSSRVPSKTQHIPVEGIETTAMAENEGLNKLSEEGVKQIWSRIAHDPRFTVTVLTNNISEHAISTTGGASIRTLLAVVANALTGKSVNPHDKCHHFTTCGAGTEGWAMEPVETVPTWRRVRNSGFCTFEHDPNNIGNVYIRTSYAVIAAVGRALKHIKRDNPVLYALSNSIAQLDTLLEDHAAVVLQQQGQAWRRFGALYEALRINCWLLLKETTIVLRELYDGCVVRKCDYEVRLRPTLVVKATGSVSGGQVLAQGEGCLNWYKEEDFNYLVLTKEGSITTTTSTTTAATTTTGMDYLYAVELVEQPGKYIAVLNQRTSCDHVCAGQRTVKELRKLACDTFAIIMSSKNSSNGSGSSNSSDCTGSGSIGGNSSSASTGSGSSGGNSNRSDSTGSGCDLVLIVVGECTQNVIDVDITTDIPDDTYYSDKKHHAAYYGSLVYHPAAAPAEH